MLRFVRRAPAASTAAATDGSLPESDPLAALLNARGIHGAQAVEAFLHPSLSALHDPYLLHGMAQAMALLATAKAENWPVVVYGDYDVDGVCACTLMTEALTAYGLTVTPHVPLRAEGYGLNIPAVEKLAESFRLLVTVDLGITNAAEITHARALGMRTIVTDHHQPGLVECPADVVLNPVLHGYPFPKLCGTGVAFKVACALLGMETALQWLDVAALATVADIVPLIDENRVLVAHGLPRMDARPGLRALLTVAGSPTPPTAEVLAYQIAPRLNAAGRIADANAGVRLLLTREPATAEALARELNTANTQRKQLEADTTAQALTQAAAHDFVRRRVLFVRGQGWHTGVIGLVAGKLNQRFSVPVCALSEEDGVLHGSLRGVRGVNLARCLQTCDDLLTRYGGHEMAAGVTLPAAHDEAFRERLERAVALSAPEEAFVPAKEYDLPLSLHQADDALVDALALLEPYGFGNPAPVFLTCDAQLLRRRAVGAGGAHLQLTLGGEGRLMDGIAFGMGEMASRLPDTVDVAYTIARETFMGRTAVKCQAQAIRPTPAAQALALQNAPETPAHMALLHALRYELAAFHPPPAGNSPPDEELLNVIPCDALAVSPADFTAAQPPAEGATARRERAPAGSQDNATPVPAGNATPVPAGEPPRTLRESNAQTPRTGDPSAFPLPPQVETALGGRQGTLLIAYTRDTAARFLAAYGSLVDVAYGTVEDPRCFHTLLLHPAPQPLRGRWQNVVLLDGALTAQSAACIAAALPHAQLHILPVSPALQSAAAQIDAGDERYRALYRLLRCNTFGGLAQTAAAAGLTEPQTLAGLAAFHALGLLDFCEAPFHYTLCEPVRCSLDQSPVLGALRALHA